MRVLLLLAVGLALTAGAATKVEPWTPLFEGVAFARGEADDPRLQKVAVVRVDLQAPGVSFLVTPDNGKAPKETTSETTSQFLERNRLQVAINANFFDPCCDEGEKDVLGLAVSRGVVVSPARVTGIGAVALCITKDNRARFTRTGPAFSTGDVWTAVAGSALVLVGGQKPLLADSAFDRTLHPRTAIGLSADGRYLILLVIDGRRPGHSEGATMDDVATWLLRFGASEGLNLDGGGSTSLVRADGEKVVPLNRPSGAALGTSENGERSNGNNLGVFARPLAGKE
ncbi:MAG: phosphodiester glycosidase family protein [Archangium sp.]|nr:phosphodiester glycosidase family protein [Archangium sp.]